MGHESHALLFRTIFETVERVPVLAWVSWRGCCPLCHANGRPVNLVKITVSCRTVCLEEKAVYGPSNAAQLAGFPLDGANTCCCPLIFQRWSWIMTLDRSWASNAVRCTTRDTTAVYLQRYAWDRGKSNLYLHSSLIDFPTNFWRKELFLFWNRKKKRNSPESCIIPSHWLFYKLCVFHRSLSWNDIESKKSSFLSSRGWFEPIVRAINQPFTRDLCWIINIVLVPRII